MSHPTTRALTILELLHSYGEMTAQELAQRLEVDPRTVRRYIALLKDIGIPIEASRAGAYFLPPDYTLPPLMFNPEEAFALALSVQLAKQRALFGAEGVLGGVAVKLERILPETIRRQVQEVQDRLAIEFDLVPTVETAASTIQTLTLACQDHWQVQIQHQAFGGAVTTRVVDPYGVGYRVGRWYVVGFCHLRQDIRTFRLDRIQEVSVLESGFTPQTVDVMAHIEEALAATPGLYQVEVMFAAPLKQVQSYVPAALGELVEIEHRRVRLTCYVQNLPWIAGFLAGIPLAQQILGPTELRDEMGRLAKRVRENLARMRV